MEKINAFIMKYDEFTSLVDKVTNGEASVEDENGKWFYVTTEEISDNDIILLIGKEIGRKINKIFIDLTENTVVITI